MPPAQPTKDRMKDFLENDLYDALRWLFVSAVTWHATDGRPERVLAMNTNFVQARALYEFYFNKKCGRDDARASRFASQWTEPGSPLYRKYMSSNKPANKRMFHLVYGRSNPANAGGSGHEGPDHLKNQVLPFANDLRRITERFIGCAKQQFRGSAQNALDRALIEAKKTADSYYVRNPL
jgi:hypothetical protein